MQKKNTVYMTAICADNILVSCNAALNEEILWFSTSFLQRIIPEPIKPLRSCLVYLSFSLYYIVIVAIFFFLITLQRYNFSQNKQIKKQTAVRKPYIFLFYWIAPNETVQKISLNPQAKILVYFRKILKTFFLQKLIFEEKI